MSSLRLALKLSMVEAPAGSALPRMEDTDETYNLLDKQVHKRKRKMSVSGEESSSTGAG